MTTFRLTELISPAFYASHRAVQSGELRELEEKGGRGSGKSSFVSVELLLLLLQHPDCHAIVLRKVGKTLRNSVYAQILWAISRLGLEPLFRCTLETMECSYLPTGQKILFFGLDDPGKLKSIKVPFGHIGIGWLEELDQFAGPEEVRNVEQSLFRGGEFAFCFKSFNPPASRRSWVNREALEHKPGRLVHHSTYLTTPREWLGEKWLADAEFLKQTNPTAYRHEYLGEVVGCGRAVFENLQLREIGEAEIRRFDRVAAGVDWGWYPDPWAFNRCAYDAHARTLYIFDELTRLKTNNKETAKLVMQRIEGWETVTADSSEPKSCGDYRDAGIRCREAVKGPGSVTESMKWLQGLTAIIIDPRRCPDTAKEFSEYEYETSREGEVLPGYVDADNHHIDAVRYATNRLWTRRGT